METRLKINSKGKEKTTKFGNISDNGYLDWLLHQNVFPLSRESKILYCLAKAKDSHFKNLSRSPFTELAFEFDYKKEFTLKVYIQIH